MKNTTPIIPVSEPECQVKSWKNLLKNAITTTDALLAAVDLQANQLGYEITEDSGFSLRVPQPYIDKIKSGDPLDPLLLQVLTQKQELEEVTGYNRDPLQENNNQTPGLLHKYQGRVLLILASACAVNCRYCFRRHFPYQDQMASGDQLSQSLQYIAADTSISEVILSGGDPLMVSDRALVSLFDRLDAIPHLKRVRIHSRLPVVIPQRLTPTFVDRLSSSRLTTSMVLHINHANEIDKLLIEHLAPLRLAGIQLLNQSVLLKQVNDNLPTLKALSESLFDAGILPYYLHLLDKVAGAAHFDVSTQQAVALIQSLREQLPGYLIPRLAVEEAGKPSKTVIA
ncbi:EF-P beta-lysylation protein EpmB [Aliikangiella maris]|uniref:EF-P beta-lysylation protein EpmB n=2 Tax=Aliikangiella maris TaxID=3162458 RepID=A0ABV3MQ66_9GAMM